MSFGYSVSDFFTTLKIANDLRKRFVDAPQQYKDIAEDVKSITIVLQDIDDVLPQRQLTDQRVDKLRDLTTQSNKILKSVQKKLDRFQDLDPTVKANGNRFRVVWKRFRYKEDDFNEFRGRLKLNISGLNTFLQSITIDTTFDIKEGVDQLSQQIRQLDVNESARQLREERNKQSTALNEIRRWLSPIDHLPQQNAIISRRQEGTGKWLLESNEFQSWLNQPGDTLFCPGIPGAGKTMIASLVVDHLRQKYRDVAEVGVAFFFFRYQSKQSHNLNDLLASFVKQLVVEEKILPPEIQALYERHRKWHSRPTTIELQDAFRVMLASHSKVFIVLDALDECQGSDPVLLDQLLKIITDIQISFPCNLFATSRPISDIAVKFNGKAKKEIRADEEDLLTYITARMPELLRSDTMKRQHLQDLVSTEVLKAADGMFLLAQLHMDSLRTQPTIGDLKRALKNLPKGLESLDATYDQAMERIKDQGDSYQRLAKRLLVWLSLAKRSLSPAEVAEALAVELGSTQIDQDFRPDPATLGSICAGLVVVDQETDVVRLVHYTTKEYFDRKLLFPNGHEEIVDVCVTYLSFGVFATRLCLGSIDFEKRLREYSLYEYAARFWGDHARECISTPSAVPRFLAVTSNISAFLQVIEFMPTDLFYYPFETAIDVKAIHIASFFGLRQIVEESIAATQSPEVKDSFGRTPLHFAALNGQDQIVAYLLQEKRVDPNAIDKTDTTVIFDAAKRGYVGVIKELLAVQRTDPNLASRAPHVLKPRLDWSEDPKHLTMPPLHIAAYLGRVEVINLLLEDARTDPVIRDENGDTALHFASSSNRPTVVGTLLQDQRIDLNSRNYRQETALMQAARAGHTHVLGLLLQDPRVDVALRDNKNRTVLSHAAIGHSSEAAEEVFKLMLDHGIEKIVDTPDARDRTPFSYLVGYGSRHILKKLITQGGADIASKDDGGRQPLHHAVEWNNLDAAALLVSEHGVCPDVKDNKGQTPLHLAARKGDKWADIVRFLVRTSGVDPDVRDNEGRTPLHLAASQGDKGTNIVRLLVRTYGADPDVRDNKGRTPLHHAVQSIWDMLKVIAELADCGADLGAKDSHGMTPLDLLRTSCR